jgi:hypothetical protein
MKTDIKIYFWLFGSLRIEGRKQPNSDFEKHFSMLKNCLNLCDFFFLKNIKKGEQLLLLTYFDNFDL